MANICCCNRDSATISGNWGNILPLGASTFFSKVTTNLSVKDSNNNPISVINSDNTGAALGNSQIVSYANGLTIAFTNASDIVIKHLGSITIDSTSGPINWSAAGGFVVGSMGVCGGITINPAISAKNFAVMATTGDLRVNGDITVSGSQANLSLMGGNVSITSSLSTGGAASDTAAVFGTSSILFGGGSFVSSQAIIKAPTVINAPTGPGTITKVQGIDCNCSATPTFVGTTAYTGPIVSSTSIEINSDIGNSTTNVVIVSGCYIHMREDNATPPRIQGSNVILISGKSILIDGTNDNTATVDFITGTNAVLFSAMEDISIASYNGSGITATERPVIGLALGEFSSMTNSSAIDVASASANTAGSISIISGNNISFGEGTSGSTLLLNNSSTGNAGYLDVHAGNNIYVYCHGSGTGNATVNVTAAAGTKNAGSIIMDAGQSIKLLAADVSSNAIVANGGATSGRGGYVGMHADNHISIHPGISVTGATPGTIKMYAINTIHLIRSITAASAILLIAASKLFVDGTLTATTITSDTVPFTISANCTTLTVNTCSPKTTNAFQYKLDSGNWANVGGGAQTQTIVLNYPATAVSTISVRVAAYPQLMQTICLNCPYFKFSDNLVSCASDGKVTSDKLASCNTSLATTSDSLKGCNSDKSVCNSSLTTCNTDKNQCITVDLPSCQATRDQCVGVDLPSCQATRDQCVGVNLPSCQTNYATTSDSLRICNSDKTVCNSSLSTCNTFTATCSDSLRSCKSDLTNPGYLRIDKSTIQPLADPCKTNLLTCIHP